MKRPNLFIVGAPRCGTTSLWSYLKDHPDIFMSAEKELYFFDTDLHPRESWAPSLEQYLANFSAGRNRKIIGEATPSYLRSERAPQDIKAFNPEAKVIIMLRNPLDVMYSLHSQGLRYGTEPMFDFEAAMRADAERSGTESLGYREFTDFPTQVQRYFDRFGRGHVHIVIFDDLEKDPVSVYQDTLRFLDVDLNFFPELTVANSNLKLRSMRLQRILVKCPPALRRVSRALFPKTLRRGIARALLNSNLVVRPRPPMDSELRLRLQKEYEPKVRELGKLLGRDLSAWLQSPNEERAEMSESGLEAKARGSGLRRR